jgi:chromosome segregation protein
MQLKKLEMCGFKSFANRTEMIFNKGITGVVGPNGCGKSNVVDAIKWVLGTLSYKAVRGEEMLDVIFKGAQGVAAMGFAEVSLTLDNSDHSLPIEFEDVTVTRRLYSTGEGEYYINKAACRLKDIRELLYGTGIGTDNYSVIEQGKIDKLVLSNPHERRLVFDEAAGISKYRAKKRETENRLDKVTQDLLRIQDVSTEVQKQLRSVRAQAGRASRYRELTDDLKGKKTRLFVHEFRVRSTRATDVAERLRAAEEGRDALRAAVEERSRAVDDAQKRMEEESGRHAELASALAALESQAAYLEKSIASSEARRAELEEERRRAAADQATHQARAEEVAALLAEEERQLAALAEEVAARAAQEAEFRRHLEDATRECSRAASNLERRKAEAVEFAHKESQTRNEQARLRQDAEDLALKGAGLREKSTRLEAELSEVGTKVVEARAAKAALEAEIATLLDRKRAEDVEHARLRTERAELERGIAHLREGKQHRVARRETLRDLETHLEGLDAGAKTLLRERPEGVLGTVADILEVAAENVAAVEGALGERAGAVVFETMAQAERAAATIRERNLGRTMIVGLDECRNGYFTDVELLTPGVLGTAGTRVKVEERHRGLVDALLGHVLLVRDRDAAREIRRENLTEWPLVTPEGELFDHPGTLTTGGARAAQGLISRKAELRKLEDEIESYLGLLAEREARFADVEHLLQASEQRLETLRHDVYDRNVDLGEASSRAEQLAVREQFLTDERRAASGELQAVDRQAAAVTDRAAALEGLLADLGRMRERAGEEIGELGRVLERYEAGKSELRDALAQARVEGAKAGEQKMAVEKRLGLHAATRDECARAAERAAELLGEIAGRTEGVEAELARSRDEREGLAGRTADARTRVEEAARAREALGAACEETRRAKSAAEQELSPREEELGRLRVEEEGLRVKGESLAARAREELQIELGEAAAAAAVEEGLDLEALSREVDELRAKIAGFGAVNVVALDQMSELEEREKFMLAQQEDLVRSKGQLEDLIRQLNRESRELFDKTFDFVKEQFNVIFRKIFGGGKADLVLEQAQNVDSMEQGLDILARPPGKELTSISLLSGGERSLTAIALVMALFKANPSPFCLLDEADAALDEKNVERYAGVVREFSADTQFIVITHNKRTMAVCDVLYGVTMEQQGVSKKVSVNLGGNGGLDVLKAKAGPAPAAPVPEGAPA